MTTTLNLKRRSPRRSGNGDTKSILKSALQDFSSTWRLSIPTSRAAIFSASNVTAPATIHCFRLVTATGFARRSLGTRAGSFTAYGARIGSSNRIVSFGKPTPPSKQPRSSGPNVTGHPSRIHRLPLIHREPDQPAGPEQLAEPPPLQPWRMRRADWLQACRRWYDLVRFDTRPRCIGGTNTPWWLGLSARRLAAQESG